MNEVQVEVRSIQVKLGQISRLFFFKQNWCLSDSVFDGEFNGGIFIFVDGLELLQNAIKNVVM